jgi:transporter family-2 protein
LAALLALVAGTGGAVQIAVQGRLGERVGAFEAVATASLIGALLALLVLLVVRRSLSGIGEALGSPKWMLLGGVMSALIILAITVAGPRIGIVATTSVLIAAQFVAAAVIDRYGWFGVERVAVSWPRLLGLALLAVGAALTLRR